MQILIFALLLLAQLGSHIICPDIPGFNHANKDTLEKGIDSLRNHHPPWAVLCHQPGGGCCNRVSCNADAGIYACYDNETENKVVSRSAVADLAQAILDDDDCVWMPSTGHVARGQAFDDDGWNVIVGIKDGESC